MSNASTLEEEEGENYISETVVKGQVFKSLKYKKKLQ